MSNEHHIPHSLRLTLFFLRIAIGISFFYLGWSILFNSQLAITLRENSMPGLYASLSSTSHITWIPTTVFAWAFFVVGVFLTIGFFTRLAAIVGIVLILINWLPGVSFTNFNPTQFINDEILVLIALIVLILGKAGGYLGLDKFLRWRRRRKEQ